MAPPESRDHRIARTSAIAIVAAAVLFALPNALALDDPLAHLASHLAFAVPAAGLFLVVVKLWPPPFEDRLGRAARRILVAGLAVFAIGQLAEGVGAFGYDGHDRTNALATLHDLALSVGVLGLLLLTAGVGLAVVVAAARHFGLIGTRWMTVLVAVVVAVLILFLLGSFVFGY